MGKKPETRMVLKEATRDWIENYGFSIKIRRVWKNFALVFVVTMITGFWATTKMTIGTTGREVVLYIVAGALLAEYVAFTWVLYRAGKQYWNEVKDKDQPVLLDPLPSWWRNKK